MRLVLGGPVLNDARCWGGSTSSTIHRWSPQYDWISIDGENMMDYVGRIETLAADMDVICDRVGIPRVKLPSKKRRFHLHYSHYYDEASRDLVASYYAKDIAEFGYTFEQARPLAPGKGSCWRGFIRVCDKWQMHSRERGGDGVVGGKSCGFLA